VNRSDHEIKAGNLREQNLTSTTSLRFKHDAWNRLVKVDHVTNPGGTESIRPRGEYEYNGLFQRVVKRADSNITDLNNSIDEQRLLYYSGDWQVVEEGIDDPVLCSQR